MDLLANIPLLLTHHDLWSQFLSSTFMWQETMIYDTATSISVIKNAIKIVVIM